jgi:hypothetical protein
MASPFFIPRWVRRFLGFARHISERPPALQATIFVACRCVRLQTSIIQYFTSAYAKPQKLACAVQ